MNERIRELAAEAFESIDYPFKQEINMPDILVEKFAELIMKECVEIIMDDKGIIWADSIRIKQAIEENFGVEP